MRGRRKGRRGFRHLALESVESRLMLHAASISGVVFLDSDGDGMRDAAEVGVPGVVVRISPVDSTSPDDEQSALTASDGSYAFDELIPGTYRITKRQSPALMDGTSQGGGVAGTAGDDVLEGLVLADEQHRTDANFAELGLRPEYLNIGWFFASSPSASQMLRETMARGEERSGNEELAAAIRSGEGEVPGGEVPGETPGVNQRPVANSTNVSVTAGSSTTIQLSGNDGDPGATQALTFRIRTLPANGVLEDSAGDPVVAGDSLSGTSVRYTPNSGFTGSDSFTFEVQDNGGTANGGQDTSAPATVSITVATGNTPFGEVVTGPFDDPGLLGVRTDLQTGAPPITQTHLTTSIDYTGYSNPPTYGPHHGVVRDAANNWITPKPTGVYSTEQPDEDLVHNLEHGHVWISYNPSLITAGDKAALEQLVRDGGQNTGVILTPRAANDAAIAVASWAHLQKLDSYDAATVRAFIETNRGHGPEGFIPSGQKPDGVEQFDDGLPHAS